MGWCGEKPLFTISTEISEPAPVAQSVECPLRGKGGSIPDRDMPESLKMVVAALRLAVELGLVDPVSG